MRVPLIDFKAQFAELKAEIEQGFREVLESSRFILGPNVAALEQEVAAYCGVKHAVAVASGTDALHLALRAAGISQGDEVITTPFTFVATAEAISYVGARPVFVDIDRESFNIDVGRIESAITARTRAILPVHLFGRPADLAPMRQICRQHGLRLIEDCAQSFGASCAGRMTGAWGDLGCFSFYPTKNLGCCGDAGMIVSDGDDWVRSLRALRNHGSRRRNRHAMIGYNSRLDELQAVVLRAKLRRIDAYNRLRRKHAAHYTARLQGSTVRPPSQVRGSRHVFHQYTILTERRDSIRRALAAAGIASAIYYPVPLHRQAAYRASCKGVSLPVSEEVASRVLSLPMYPELTAAQVDRVCDVLLAAAAGGPECAGR